MTVPNPLFTPSKILAWLTITAASQLDLPDIVIEPDRELAEYGFDSTRALQLTAAVEDRFALKLSPMLVWEYPTLAELTNHIASQLASTI